ncbi:hypothetical protein CPB97_008750 [Podila verticillata]|nr:hypothetical protein CPB97_008750 [Podila verticillata]
MKSLGALSYATASVTVLALTGVAITGGATRNRTANIVLFLLCTHLAELPFTVMLADALFYTWLKFTGTFQESPLVRFFYYINIITAVGLFYLFKRSYDSRQVAQRFLNQLSKESKDWVELPGLDTARFWQQLLNPFHWPRDCTIYPNIPYWVQEEQLSAQKSDGWESVIDMSLDIYRPNVVQGGDDRPVLFFIHGGGWTTGSKYMMGPLLSEMISHEWVVVSVDYRLKAKAGYPTQLLDCKRALRWVKDEIRTFGGNPDNIVMAGESAGGQLAAMLALTPNMPEFQPGFETVDTTVQGCAALSAVLDLVDLKNHNRIGWRSHFIKNVAFREGAAESAENLKFLTEHSPMLRIQSTGVPFLVVHGDLDIMTPVQATRDFVTEFQSKSSATINYLEIPGGNHCFHALSSPRSWYTIIATAEWLNHNFDRHGSIHSSEKKKVHELVEWGWE